METKLKEENRPNLFNFATKELSQDAFLSWIISWADQKYAETEPELNIVGKNLIRLFLDKPNFEIETVKLKLQWEKIDIGVEVNNTHLIVIEDKTSSKAHGTQLADYKDAAKKGYQFPEENFTFIYLKTGNESKFSLKSVENQGYKLIGRSEILPVFTALSKKNDIYEDFVGYLTNIDLETNDYLNIQKLRSKQRTAQGLFLALENHLTFKPKDNWGWQYVANQSGGFECFWLNFIEKELYKIYIQIGNATNGIFENENDIQILNKDFNIGFRIELKTSQSIDLNEISLKLIELGKQSGIDLVKPNVLRAGKTSAVAYLKNPLTMEDGKLNFKDLIIKIEYLVKIIDEFGQI